MTELNSNISVSQQKSLPTFDDFCVYSQAEETTKEKSFVGIKNENGKLRIYFPMGFRLEKPSADVCKQDFDQLIEVLSDVSLQRYFSEDELETSSLDFPFYAYVTVLRYYLDFGYFIESEMIYKKGLFGKISWSRTIKNIEPQVVRNKQGRHQIIYLDQVSCRINRREDSLITKIHKYCVKEAVGRIGLLYGILETNVEVPEISFNYEFFSEVIQNKISTTFMDKHLALFSAMLTMVRYLANKDNRDNAENSSETFFGVSTFAPIWEGMVDKIFNNLPEKINKNDFYPHLNYVPEHSTDDKGLWYQEKVDAGAEHKRSTLRPDTIMQIDKRLFVIDSKFYKYGLINKHNLIAQCKYLPGAESVCKQMAYAEYAETKKDYPPRNVFNVFIMPYCAEGDNVAAGSNSFFMKSKGYIYGDWKDKEKSYHKIACILLDLKSVMKNYSSSRSAQQDLANMVAPLRKKLRKRKHK